MIMTETRSVIGVDIGGTKIAAGIVGPTGEIRHRVRTLMFSNDGAAAGLAAVKSAIDAVIEESTQGEASRQRPSRHRNLRSGPLDPINGVVLNPPTFCAGAIFPWPPRFRGFTTCPLKWRTTPTPQPSPKPFGAPGAASRMFSTPPLVPALAPASSWASAFTTDAPARLPKAAT